jgi:hypothetical protein
LRQRQAGPFHERRAIGCYRFLESGGATPVKSRLVSRFSGELSIDLTLNWTDTVRVVQNGSGCGSHEPIERANSVTLEQSTTTPKK